MRLVQGADGGVRAGDHWNACSDGNGPGFHLVSHLADHLWAWTNEPDSSILAGLGKVCSL